LRCCIFVFNALHLVDLVTIGLVLRLPKLMVYYGFSPGFIFSFLSTGQEIGWKELLRYDLYCVEWDVKPQLSQSVFELCVAFPHVIDQRNIHMIKLRLRRSMLPPTEGGDHNKMAV